ncbi:MAG: hypothetical protein RI907_1558 [Pseudomonadota bacterium]
MTQPLTLLWRDERMVAIHKPSGWLVHRSALDPHEDRIVQTQLRDQLGQWVYPVHRLDKGTSGVLLLALDADMARELTQAFERRVVNKRYVALVRGWPAASWSVDHALKPDDAPEDAPEQDATTAFQLLARLSLPVPVDRYPTTRVALVLAEPETGRRHQIRRHLKHVAHPIIGDATHGKGPHNRLWAERLGTHRLWLHAWQLSLPHPLTKVPLCFTSACALADNADWQHLLATWDWQPEAANLGQRSAWQSWSAGSSR